MTTYLGVIFVCAAISSFGVACISIATKDERSTILLFLVCGCALLLSGLVMFTFVVEAVIRPQSMIVRVVLAKQCLAPIFFRFGNFQTGSAGHD